MSGRLLELYRGPSRYERISPSSVNSYDFVSVTWVAQAVTSNKRICHEAHSGHPLSVGDAGLTLGIATRTRVSDMHRTMTQDRCRSILR